MVVQIHYQKGGIADDVDPAQSFIELQTVKNYRFIPVTGDIGQVQVAVTFPDMAAGLAC